MPTEFTFEEAQAPETSFTFEEAQPPTPLSPESLSRIKPPMQFLPGGMNEPGTREEKLAEVPAIWGSVISAPGAAIDAVLPKRVSELAFTPLVNPKTSTSDAAFRRAHPVIGGIEAGVVDLAKSFTSPVGIATLGLGVLPKAAQRAISLTFAAQMASSMPQLATQIGETWKLPDSPERTQKLAELFTTATGTGAFTALATKHGLTRTPAENLAAGIKEAPLENVQSPDVAARAALALPRPAPAEVPPDLLRTKELVDRAIQEATQKVVVPGQQSAIELLRDADIYLPRGTVRTPSGREFTGTFPRPESPEIRKAKELLEDVGARQPEVPTIEKLELQTVREMKPLRTSADIVRERLEKRDFVAAVSELVSQPAASQKKIVEDVVGVGRKKVPLTAAERTIFNEVWEKVYRESLGLPPLERTPNAIQPESPQPVRGVRARDEIEEVPTEVSGEEVSVGGDQARPVGRGETSPPNAPEITSPPSAQRTEAATEVQPVIPTGEQKPPSPSEPLGGGPSALPPEKRAKSSEAAKDTTRLMKLQAIEDAGMLTKKQRAEMDDLKSKAEAAKQGVLDTAIKSIEDLQKKIRGTGENLGMNVPVALLDTALEVARLALKAGKTVAEAVDAAIEHIRKNASFQVKKDFKEAEVRAALMSNLRIASDKPPIRVEGTEEKMRKSAERAVNSDEIPEPVREQISAAPESQYKVQPQEDVNKVLDAMTDAQLAAVPRESNIYVGSRLKLSKRLFDQGKYDEGYDVFQEVASAGTDFGQNINQFKMLKGVTPFDVVKIVNQGLKKSGRDPLTKPQEQKVAKSANESIEANNELKKAQDDWLRDPTDENAKKADAANEAAHKADLATQKLVNQYTPKSWPKMLKAFVQGNLITPISQVANVVGNVLGAGMETGSRGVGSMLDQIRTMFTGGERKLAVAPLAGPKAAASGLISGAKQGVEILKRGSGDVVKGEYRQTLRPLRALQTAFAKNPDVPTVKGQVPFNERVRMAIEGTFGIAPEIMLRLLSAADKPSFEAARGRLINEQAKLKNVPSQYRATARKFPELFFDRETINLIENESLNAVFQNKSLGISYLESWIKNHGGDWADLGFTMLVAPYRLTPWNLVGRTLIYNPLVAAMRTAYFASKGNTRQAELNAGRMIVGGLLYGAGYFLYKNGLIGPSLDSRDETRKERLLAGEVLPPNHVNISGLNRLAKGGDPKFQPGDETIDLTRGGGAAGAILSSVANIGRDFEKKPEGSTPFLASLLKNSTLEQASFTINQSFLKGVTGILDAVRDRNLEPYMNGVESSFLSVGAPNTLATLSRASRKYVPDLKDPSQLKSFENLARERFGIAGLDDYLPLKRDLWGKPMLQTPEGRNALLYHLFDISKNRQVTGDPVSLELYDLWRRTAKREVIPSIPERQITIANKTHALEPSQYERLVELIGQQRRLVVEKMVENPQFQNANSDTKIRLLEHSYRVGADTGKALFLKETPATQLKEANKPKAGFQP